MKTYSYDVDLVSGEYSCSHRVDDAVHYNRTDEWVDFYGPTSADILASFRAHAVVAVVKDLDSGQDVAA